MTASWPWITIAGLGAFHGLNPAMGWLFAVAIGLQRDSFRAVLVSLIPIAIGHALAIACAVALFILAGRIVEPRLLGLIAGFLLIAWGVWHFVAGHGGRVRFGMTASLLGLGAWSFLMAMAHGAGIMLFPALMPLCAPTNGAAQPASTLGETALAAVAVHTAAMLAVSGILAIIIYQWVGVGILRQGWINLDRLWSAALVLSGLVLLA